MRVLHRACWALLCLIISGALAAAQPSAETYEPRQGQEGKDVVWVPTPPALVEYMLELARVTPQDYVMDLGSGDGRNIIAAAKRGARALGVEFNPDMVTLARRSAAAAGVDGKAQFVQGDMYEADISQATVLALFLLNDNLRKLTPKFADLTPGTRIVINTFTIPDWEPEQTSRLEECIVWCTALLYLVPAKVADTWRMAQGLLTIEQRYQTFSGTLTTDDGVSTTIDNGRVSGDRISFTAAGVEYSGQVNGDSMSGAAKGGAAASWSATRLRK